MEIEGLEIKWFGHDSFLIEGDKTIYIDPYVLPAGSKKADIILVTHEHFDHFDRSKIKELIKQGTEVIIPPGCASGLDCKFKIIREDETLELGSVKITAVPAYNINKFRMGKIPFHSKGEGFGYIIEMDGVRVYHASDTDFIDEMKKLKVDIALLPISGNVAMDINEAAEAANAIKPKVVIPMHYNTLPGMNASPEEFAKLVNKDIRVVINPQ
ncbi:MAG: MBL fold metallo-hydrolase [Candidatus Nanoarchaeia archaeon]|jgi:L-ascorbate metabolism protein UlaG (beta-lactamase superfamily)